MVRETNNAIGYDRLAERLGVTKTAVKRTTTNGRWPAAWALVIRDEAAKLDPPRHVPNRYFSFREADNEALR